jgi:hypothetical protein
MIKKLTLVSLIIFFVSCNSYQSEFKNEAVSLLKELNDIPAGIDKNGEITLETIEFHCEFAQDNIQEYQEENLLITDFMELHYASFRVLYEDKPIEQIENFMKALYNYCNLQDEFNTGWTSVEELEEIYINEWKPNN